MGAATGAALDEAAPLDNAAPLEEAAAFGAGLLVGMRFGNGVPIAEPPIPSVGD